MVHSLSPITFLITPRRPHSRDIQSEARLVAEIDGSVGECAYAQPGLRFVAQHSLADGLEVRTARLARLGGYCHWPPCRPGSPLYRAQRDWGRTNRPKCDADHFARNRLGLCL